MTVVVMAGTDDVNGCTAGSEIVAGGAARRAAYDAIGGQGVFQILVATLESTPKQRRLGVAPENEAMVASRRTFTAQI